MCTADPCLTRPWRLPRHVPTTERLSTSGKTSESRASCIPMCTHPHVISNQYAVPSYWRHRRAPRTCTPTGKTLQVLPALFQVSRQYMHESTHLSLHMKRSDQTTTAPYRFAHAILLLSRGVTCGGPFAVSVTHNRSMYKQNHAKGGGTVLPHWPGGMCWPTAQRKSASWPAH